MGRVLGIDYGTKRIGIAISDERKILATPIATLAREKSFAGAIAQMQGLIAKYLPFDLIVIGLPLHLDGKESDMSLEVRKFAALIESHFSLPVVLFDERLSSMQVEKELNSRNMKKKKQKEITDALAASTILQTYLDSL